MQIQSQTTLRGLTCLVNVTLVRVVDLGIPTYLHQNFICTSVLSGGSPPLHSTEAVFPYIPPLGELHAKARTLRLRSPRSVPGPLESNSQLLVKICQTKCHRLLRTQQTETIFNVHGLRSLCRVEDSVFPIPSIDLLDSVCLRRRSSGYEGPGKTNFCRLDALEM
jgi:hypothetical protein